MGMAGGWTTINKAFSCAGGYDEGHEKESHKTDAKSDTRKK
jgi:hypothetical protein